MGPLVALADENAARVARATPARTQAWERGIQLGVRVGVAGMMAPKFEL
jgi:hypothetical protein